MVIKVAVKKDNDKIIWRDPYSRAIRNRLRVDRNLLDVPDKEAAIANLGLIPPEEVVTKEELRNEINNLRVWISSNIAQHNS